MTRSEAELERETVAARRVAIGWPWLIVWASVVFAFVDVAPAGAFGCLEEPATIVGTLGDDVLVGTNGRDVIVARAGNDIIRGRRGGDIICAGRGADIVYLGPRRPGTWNSVDGGPHDDVLVGGATADGLFGGDGDDILFGREGRDFLDGGEGADILRGGWGNDRLSDDEGDDVVLGGPGSDDFELRHENDPDGNDVYSSGGGIRDALSFYFAPVSVDLSLGRTLGGVFGDDRFVGPWDMLQGTMHPDTLIGDAGTNVILGLGGNDHIEGRAGDDHLFGGGGTDLLDGGDGTDECLEGETVLFCEP